MVAFAPIELKVDTRKLLAGLASVAATMKQLREESRLNDQVIRLQKLNVELMKKNTQLEHELKKWRPHGK